MHVDPKQLQAGISEALERLRGNVTPDSPADHLITVLESIESDDLVAELVAGGINAVAKHLPDRIPGT